MLHAVLDQVFPRRALQLDGAGGGNVISRDAVAEQGEHAGSLDLLHRIGLHAHVVEIRWIFHVGGCRVPSIQIALGHGQRVPALVPLEDLAVDLLEHGRMDAAPDCILHFLLARPNVAQIHRLAVLPLTERLVVKIDVHSAG